MKDIFNSENHREILARINKLTHETQPSWGKMDVAQMLAHCNVTYEMAYEDKHKRPGSVARLLLKLFIKRSVVNEKPYPKNARTAPQFKIADQKDFEAEKIRILDYLNKTFKLGADHFEGRESFSFGPLTTKEWNNMFYKHLNHHLKQFGV